MHRTPTQKRLFPGESRVHWVCVIHTITQWKLSSSSHFATSLDSSMPRTRGLVTASNGRGTKRQSPGQGQRNTGSDMTKPICVVLYAVLLAAVLALGSRWLINARSETASNACVMHLREIAGLKEQWGLDHHKTTNDVPTWDDLRPYMRRGNADL